MISVAKKIWTGQVNSVLCKMTPRVYFQLSNIHAETCTHTERENRYTHVYMSTATQKISLNLLLRHRLLGICFGTILSSIHTNYCKGMFSWILHSCVLANGNQTSALTTQMPCHYVKCGFSGFSSFRLFSATTGFLFT